MEFTFSEHSASGPMPRRMGMPFFWNVADGRAIPFRHSKRQTLGEKGKLIERHRRHLPPERCADGAGAIAVPRGFSFLPWPRFPRVLDGWFDRAGTCDAADHARIAGRTPACKSRWAVLDCRGRTTRRPCGIHRRAATLGPRGSAKRTG